MSASRQRSVAGGCSSSASLYGMWVLLASADELPAQPAPRFNTQRGQGQVPVRDAHGWQQS